MIYIDSTCIDASSTKYIMKINQVFYDQPKYRVKC